MPSVSCHFNAPVQAICLAYIIIIPKITEHSFVSPTMPWSPENKFLSIDQIPLTDPLTDDTYPHGPSCLCSSPSCSLHSKEVDFLCQYSSSCPFLPGYSLAGLYTSVFIDQCFFFSIFKVSDEIIVRKNFISSNSSYSSSYNMLPN